MADTSDSHLPLLGLPAAGSWVFPCVFSAPKTRLLFVGVLSLVGIAGCLPRDSAKKTASRETPHNEPAAARQQGKQNPDAKNREETASQSRNKKEPAPTRLPPATGSKAIPSPDAICGHAIAFAGWSPGSGDESQRLLFFDPGDNAIEAGTHNHRWEADPGESPIQFGERRPVVVLSPAEAFTVVGAVLLSPKANAAADEPVARPAANMPDLSQALDNKWTGLCGPASAADLLFAIASRRPSLLDGFERGPSAQADRDAARLIAGENGTMHSDSLAAHMKLAADGSGVTNEGMRSGVATWLSSRDAENWSVTLEWLTDLKKTPGEQTQFFKTLAATARKGGGAVLCLWPGTEFSDRSTGEAAAEQASQSEAPNGPKNAQDAGGQGEPNATPDQGNPSRERADSGRDGTNRDQAATSSSPPPDADSGTADEGSTKPAGQADQGSPQPANRTRGFDGKKSTPQAAAAALDRGRRSLERAKRALNDGSHRDAMDAVAIAISTLRPHAANNKECRAALKEAAELAPQIEAGIPRQGPVSTKPTRFQ